MRYRLEYASAARADLNDLADFIADRAGVEIATGHVGRIESACASLRALRQFLNPPCNIKRLSEQLLFGVWAEEPNPIEMNQMGWGIGNPDLGLPSHLPNIARHDGA